ncbi:MAG: efflux RND transporter periplasmic adaptor subunit [Proteobacteria bacterium]|nr:efflux RND transporter periplasmic adaptor subunit [Pseudomonadota bacterium]
MTNIYKLIILLLISNPVYCQWFTANFSEKNNYRWFNGEVEAVNKATVSAQTTGRVAKINYDVDDFVAQDSILVALTNTEQTAHLQQAKANAKAARIAFDQAQTDYLRVQDIFAKKLLAKSKLDEAQSQRDTLKAQLAAANSAVVSANKQFEYTIIRAPYDGIVTNRYVELGETVNIGTPIMEGLSLKQLRIITYIPEKIINQVNSNSHTKILNNGKEISAQNIVIFPYADKVTRTFKTRIDVNADEFNLFPGMTVKVAFKIGSKKLLMIPYSAIINRGELTLVYVKYGEDKILRHVKTGRKYADEISIIAGLSAGEDVLTNPLSE